MKPETAAKIKHGVWGLICGAAIAMIVGFTWGGWTTFGTSRTQTKEAVLASQAAICVAQFMKQPNPDEKLKALEEVSSWRRPEAIEKGGWDKMPGQAKADYAPDRLVPRGDKRRMNTLAISTAQRATFTARKLGRPTTAGRRMA